MQQEYDVFGGTIESANRNVEQRRSERHAAQLKAKEYTVREAGIAETSRCYRPRPRAISHCSGSNYRNSSMPIPPMLPSGSRRSHKSTIALRRQAGELEMTLQQLAPDRSVAAASLEHARAQMTEAAAHLNQRRLVVEERARARAELLGGEATASHRTRINEARRTARETRARAREASSATSAAFQSASARCEEAASGLEVANCRRVCAGGSIPHGLPGCGSATEPGFCSDCRRPGCVQNATDKNSRDRAGCERCGRCCCDAPE